MGDFPYGGGNSGGVGGRRRKIQTGKSGGKPPKKECCPMVAAVRSVKRGKLRLARRYAVMSIGLIAARIAGITA